MQPELQSETYVFCTLKESAFSKTECDPLLIFKEKEGITLILEKNIADENHLSYAGTWSLITLNVHSDLQAIGFLARVTTLLAEHQIPVNAVSAYYHDHLFVPKERGEEALKVLQEVQHNQRV